MELLEMKLKYHQCKIEEILGRSNHFYCFYTAGTPLKATLLPILLLLPVFVAAGAFLWSLCLGTARAHRRGAAIARSVYRVVTGWMAEGPEFVSR
jgi:hypothetical protein